MTRLNILLDVLDRAETLTQTAAAPTDNSDQLLADVKRLNTPYDDTVLQQAVQAHLTQPPLTSLSSPEPFDWGWARPATPEERETRLRRSQRMAWADTAAKRRQQAEWGRLGSAVLGGLLGVAALTMTAVFSSPPGLRDPVFPLTLLIVGGLSAWGGFFAGSKWMDWRFRRCFNKRQSLLSFHGDLYYLEDVYLMFPQTRRYLRAVLTSPFPTLLQGDAEILNHLAIEAVLDEKAQESLDKAKKSAEKAAKAREGRMERFADVLKDPD